MSTGCWPRATRPRLNLATGWDDGQRVTRTNETLASTGLGLRWLPLARIQAELFWGHDLPALSQSRGDRLQDDGVYFRVSAAAF